MAGPFLTFDELLAAAERVTFDEATLAAIAADVQAAEARYLKQERERAVTHEVLRRVCSI